MKRILIFLTSALFIMHSTVCAQQRIISNNLTGTVSFIPDSSLVIQTKEEKMYIIVPDEDLGAIFTTTNAEMFSEMVAKIPKLKDSVLKIRGTRLGSLSKIYPQQFRFFANKYKKRGLGLNAETNVYRISGYNIFLKVSSPVVAPPQKLDSIQQPKIVTQSQQGWPVKN